MVFIWLVILFVVGLLVASFTIIPVLIILFFGIPLTNKLEKKGLLKHKNGIKKGYTFNVIIFPLVYLGILWVINNYFPAGTMGFLIGTGSSLFFGLGQVGANKNNIADYFQVNQRHFTASQEDVLQQVFH